MSATIKIPCEEGKLIDVEITENLDMFFPDYDIEYDLSMAEFGEEPSFCVAALMEWQHDPMQFICGSGLVPIAKLGIITCKLAMQAIETVQKSVNFICFNESVKLIKACERSWRSDKRALLNRIYHHRQNLTKCWNKCIIKRQSVRTQMPTFSESSIVNIAEQCANFVFSFWINKEMIGGYDRPSQEPCEIAKSAREAISSVTWIGSGHTGSSIDFRHYFIDRTYSIPEELINELKSIRQAQAVLSVKILEIL